MEEKQYSIKELCSIFNINPNTFPSIAKRLEINTEEYCKVEINDYKAPKKYYNELAYKKIEEYSLSKEKKNVAKEKEISKYLQKLEDKDKIIDELRKQLEFNQKMLVAEKGEKQQLQSQMYLLAEDNKKINQLENENSLLSKANEDYIQENHKLEQEKEKLEEEINKMKNRNFWARLFNK
jgi:chromosome segregation ATPase